MNIKSKELMHILNECINERVADMYILPNGRNYKIIFHSDVTIMPIKKLSIDDGVQFIAYLKYQANMAVSEHRRPQVGSLKKKFKNIDVNLRLSSVGDFRGMESLVIRFIYQLNGLNNHELIDDQFGKLKKIVASRGLVLFSGPMGSGKTTTMYKLAKEAMKDQVVMTIEDPVEIEEDQFIQLQVNDQANMSYDNLLKVGLRHRPEAFIIGEIRDPQTAKMAVRAALSGHLVLSTVHAQNVFGTITRMEQLGIERHYLSQVLTSVCYQRLIPTVSEGSAVLYDMLYKDKLEFAINNSDVRSNKMTADWRIGLEKCVEQHKITTHTAKKYLLG
ncbi:competence type IV pilus ATPase ComGA [Paucilactobacillus suebicus]|nr:competence type IV pilus ATPase ComGA [Paucilactobacillus suebicus]